MVILYLLVLLAALVIPILIGFYAFYAIWGDIKGAPFVPTSNKLIEQILKEAKLKKGQVFVELGSGDGRVVRAAVGDYGVKGLGVDVHPLLIWYSRFLSRKLKNIKFKRQDFFQTDLKQVDVLFLFLLPKTLIKLRKKILTECKKGSVIISHGFKVEGWDKKLIKVQKRDLFSTYYYKV